MISHPTRLILAAAILALCGTPALAQEHRLDTPAYKQCIAPGVSGAGEAQCNYAELARQDAVLNEVYQAIMSATGVPARRTALRDGERAWIKHRDQVCGHAGDDFAGGSEQPAMVAGCTLSETERRILYLRSLPAD
ncbi:MAG TPA: lysozyme inhibitor LprI family protein [Caulobacteraceae bacterium]|jgi:uncharacterized protein YecT (DUF1311 family)